MQKKEISAAIQQSLWNRGPLEPLSYLDTRKYIQHNVLIEDGIAQIFKFADELPRGQTSVRVCRSAEDGDFSFVHNDYRLGDRGPMVAFEVHRWEDGKIVEHWDNLQSLPASPNPSGRTMMDGDSIVRDIEKTVENKKLIERFTNEVLIERKLGGLSKFFAGESLIQHNPQLGDGISALRSALEAGEHRYDKLHMLIGEGNMVLAISAGSARRVDGTTGTSAIYDLYRIAQGSIAEHWDVVETIAPPDEWRNQNGKF